jgi:hypothetical protein
MESLSASRGSGVPRIAEPTITLKIMLYMGVEFQKLIFIKCIYL